MGKIEERIKRKKRIRGKVSGTSQRPRLAVYRSNVNIYGQLIDDAKAVTLLSVSISDLSEKESGKATKTEKAKLLGIEIAKKALKKGIKTIVFDRGGYVYHGRVKAMAEGAREGGLEF